MPIHPLALVSPDADVDHNVEIGPFAVVEPDVTIDAGCHIAAHAVIKQGTHLGRNNFVAEGAVLGGLPQHTSPPEKPGKLVLGQHNVIREMVTVHRSLDAGSETRIGNHNLLMVGCHVAHDCRLADSVILTNHVLLAGHVEIDQQAYLAGAVAVHQFCRIGRTAMIGGMARILKDVPPFVTVDGATGLVVGLNLVGLRRNGFAPEEIRALKEAYRVIYRQGLRWQEVQETLQRRFADGPAALYRTFFAGGRRGFVQERRVPDTATIKLHGDKNTSASQQVAKKAVG